MVSAGAGASGRRAAATRRTRGPALRQRAGVLPASAARLDRAQARPGLPSASQLAATGHEFSGLGTASLAARRNGLRRSRWYGSAPALALPWWRMREWRSPGSVGHAGLAARLCRSGSALSFSKHRTDSRNRLDACYGQVPEGSIGHCERIGTKADAPARPHRRGPARCLVPGSGWAAGPSETPSGAAAAVEVTFTGAGLPYRACRPVARS